MRRQGQAKGYLIYNRSLHEIPLRIQAMVTSDRWTLNRGKWTIWARNGNVPEFSTILLIASKCVVAMSLEWRWLGNFVLLRSVSFSWKQFVIWRGGAGVACRRWKQANHCCQEMSNDEKNKRRGKRQKRTEAKDNEKYIYTHHVFFIVPALFLVISLTKLWNFLQSCRSQLTAAPQWDQNK